MPSSTPASVVDPVPPLLTPSVPVTSVPRLTNDVPTTPFVAFRNPFKEPTEKFDAKRLVVDAVVAKNDVVVAAAPVAVVKVRFVSAVDPVTAKLSAVVSPAEFVDKSVVDALFATTNAKTPAAVDWLQIVSFAYGLVVPRPTFSVELVNRTTVPVSVQPPADALVKLW